MLSFSRLPQLLPLLQKMFKLHLVFDPVFFAFCDYILQGKICHLVVVEAGNEGEPGEGRHFGGEGGGGRKGGGRLVREGEVAELLVEIEARPHY